MIFPAAVAAAVQKPTPLYAAAAALSEANRWTAVNGWASAIAYCDPDTEHAALLEGVGLVDASALARYVLRGPDAARVIGRLATVPADGLEPGETARGLILTNAGCVVDLVEATRLSGDLFLLTSAAPADRRLQLARRGFDLEIEAIAGRVAALRLLGPDARARAAAAGFPVEARAVYAQARGVETIVRPLDGWGLSGVEILYPAEEALTLWERARRGGVVAVGLEALERLRIEAGAPRPGLDFVPADHARPGELRRPNEIGLPHLAPPGRAWFNGRRLLAQSSEAGAAGDRRLVTLEIDADETQPGAVVMAGGAPPLGRLAGTITSAAVSPRRRAAVAFADIAYQSFGKPLSVASADGGFVAARFLETAESRLAAAFRTRDRTATDSRGPVV